MANKVLDKLREADVPESSRPIRAIDLPSPSLPARGLPVADGTSTSFTVGKAVWTDRRGTRKNILAKLDPKGEKIADMKIAAQDGDDVVFVGFTADPAFVEDCRNNGIKRLVPVQDAMLTASAKSCPTGTVVAMTVFRDHCVITMATDGVPVLSRVATGISEETCLLPDGSMNEDGFRDMALEIKRTTSGKNAASGTETDLLLLAGNAFSAKGARSALSNMTSAKDVREMDLADMLGDADLLDVMMTTDDKRRNKILTSVSWGMYSVALFCVLFLLGFTYMTSRQASERLLSQKEEGLLASLPDRDDYEKSMRSAENGRVRISAITDMYRPVVFVGAVAESDIPDDVRILSMVSGQDGLTLVGYVDAQPELREMVLAETAMRIRDADAFDRVEIVDKLNRETRDGGMVLSFTLRAVRGDGK